MKTEVSIQLNLTHHQGEVVRQALIEYVEARDRDALHGDGPPNCAKYVARRYAAHSEAFRASSFNRVNANLKEGIAVLHQLSDLP